MNNPFTKLGGFRKRTIKTVTVGRLVSQDPDHAMSRQVEISTMGVEGLTHAKGLQMNCCDCSRIVNEKTNPLLGFCSCGCLVCEKCARVCSQCKNLSCPSCSGSSLFDKDVFCRRHKGGLALVKRVLIGKETK
jgi:hypothetical protein